MPLSWWQTEQARMIKGIDAGSFASHTIIYYQGNNYKLITGEINVHISSIRTRVLGTNEMEEMEKILELQQIQQNLITTMTTANESTLAAEKMNVTKVTCYQGIILRARQARYI
uniref:Uncharacterized protein n=1 Tax=Onchocerca volvulus TaxID=6282 RepID=A0A8R1XMW0_ONCVO